MTTNKIHQTIDKYIANFKQCSILPVRHAADTLSTDYNMQLQHCHWMLNTMKDMVFEDNIGKVYRWLGFIQGVLWAQSIYSIDSLKGDNRNDATTDRTHRIW